MRALHLVRLALESLRRTPLRVILTTLGVAIAAGALVAMVAFALGLQEQIETPFRALDLLNNIQVTPEEGGAALDDAALARMGELPGVAAAYPDIRLRGVNVRYDQRTQIALAIALPREAALVNVPQEILVAGRFFSEAGKNEGILGAELVRGLGFRNLDDILDQEVTLEAAGLNADDQQSFSLERKQFVVRIVGVYEAPPLMPPPARRAIILPVELMKQVPGVQFDSVMKRLKSGDAAPPPGYASATVRVRQPTDLDRVERQVQALGYHTHTVLSRMQGMRTFFLVLQLLLASIGTVALVVAALGIVNTLLMSVLERTQEIGLYKAIGASDGDLFVLFLTEAMIVGLLGGLLGLALGYGVASGLGAAAGAYSRTHGGPEALVLFAFPAWLLAATVLFSMLVSALAGVYPALRAARIDPIRALRRE